MGFWPVVQDMMRNVEIIIIVGDARMPEISVNAELVRKCRQMRLPYIVAYSKSDLVSDEDLRDLKKRFPEACFVAGPKNLGVSFLRKRVKILASQLKLDEPRIGVVGYPNIGKSALINALARRRQTVVSPIPGTTRGVQWVKAGNLRILDSPGVIPFEDKNRKLVLIGSKSAYQVKTPDKYALDIINMFLIKDKQKLKDFYGVELASEEPYDVFIEIGLKRRFLKKGGEVDEDRTARTIIREWQIGKLRI